MTGEPGWLSLEAFSGRGLGGPELSPPLGPNMFTQILCFADTRVPSKSQFNARRTETACDTDREGQAWLTADINDISFGATLTSSNPIMSHFHLGGQSIGGFPSNYLRIKRKRPQLPWRYCPPPHPPNLGAGRSVCENAGRRGGS